MKIQRKTDRVLTFRDRLAIVIATAGGAGFFPKIPGTIGSLLGVLAYLITYGYGSQSIYLTIIAILTLISVWAAGRVELIYGEDAPVIVIDEVIGQMLTLGFVIRSGTMTILIAVILGFLLFRFFDILKPLPIRYLESLPRGFGVIADDVGAGVYSCIVLVLLESITGRIF